ncbi:MAG TPA: lipopolysaccharide assembly protein LapA domain-containing protein [Burkholderiales bacterium]|jgi:uncharacterized integral membrane protein
MNWRLPLSLVLIGAVVLFVFQNIGVVEIRFLFWSAAVSRSLLLVMVLVVGIVVGWIWHSLWRRARQRVRRL